MGAELSSPPPRFAHLASATGAVSEGAIPGRRGSSIRSGMKRCGVSASRGASPGTGRGEHDAITTNPIDVKRTDSLFKNFFNITWPWGARDTSLTAPRSMNRMFVLMNSLPGTLMGVIFGPDWQFIDAALARTVDRGALQRSTGAPSSPGGASYANRYALVLEPVSDGRYGARMTYLSVTPLRPARRPALVLTLSLGALTAPLNGQTDRFPPVVVPIAVDALPAPYVAPERTYRLLTGMRTLHPDRIDLHLAAAREATAMGVTDPDADRRKAWLRLAEEAARQAVAVDSLSAEAQYWLAASLGLRADIEGGKTKINLAREAYETSKVTLELNDTHTGAHHIVGRLHSGAKRLGWASRMIARGLGLGGILNEASWESAELHMGYAAEQDPETLVNVYEFGKLLIERLDRPDEGRALLQSLADREPRHSVDSVYIEHAASFLAGWDGNKP